MALIYSLPSYLHFSRQVWIAAGIGFVVALGAMALLVWAGKRRYVVIGGSPAVDLIAYHLGRIADTLDHLSAQNIPPLRGFQRARQATQAEIKAEPPHQPQVEFPSEAGRENAPETVHEQPKVRSHRAGMSLFGR